MRRARRWRCCGSNAGWQRPDRWQRARSRQGRQEVRTRKPTGAARRGSPPCRRCTRWTSAAPGSTIFLPSSKATGSAARSRARNICRRRPPSSATSSPAWCATRQSSIPLIDDALSKGWPLKRIDAILRAVLRAGSYELEHRKDVPGARRRVRICRRRARLRRKGRDRHGQRGARPDRAPIPRRRVRAGHVASGDPCRSRRSGAKTRLIARYLQAARDRSGRVRPRPTMPAASIDARLRRRRHRGDHRRHRRRRAFSCPTIRPTRSRARRCGSISPISPPRARRRRASC